MFHKKSAKVTDAIPLSNDTIMWRIRSLPENAKTNLISRKKCTKFSFQMDETTDIVNSTILMAFMYHPCLDTVRDLLLCKPL